jgi:polo-like kinase 1
MELHKRRKALTEPEVRYLFRQTILAVAYLHQVKVIHRDLKLGNLFLNDDMEIKLGDFGLATRVEMDGERKKTLCGTPNYIAPEVLTKKGHSYEVDIWSLGCILFTLLVGKPPFETKTLKDTYQRIKKNEYHIPAYISQEARLLIGRLLQPLPTARPTAEDILTDPFFSSGHIPIRLPISCLTTAPHFKKAHEMTSRKPLADHNAPGSVGVAEGGAKPIIPAYMIAEKIQESTDWHLGVLLSQLTSCLDSNPHTKNYVHYDEAEDPASMPVFWISKWVDYTDKYGLGYQLCDNSIGVLFNDSSRLLLGADGESMQYILRDTREEFYTLSKYPDTMHKKVTLIKYFRDYMSEHLLKAGGSVGEREIDDGVRLPFLRAWSRTKSAIVFHLSNGTLQINFFQDHTKVIICPLMQAVTYIDESKSIRTYRLEGIEKYGCSKELATRLKYGRSMTEKLLEKIDTKGNNCAGDGIIPPLHS